MSTKELTKTICNGYKIGLSQGFIEILQIVMNEDKEVKIQFLELLCGIKDIAELTQDEKALEEATQIINLINTL